jgi:hypothetical protein
MALGDPLLAVTLARLPETATQLAALGVVKSLAILWESPIIMVLHASTALSGWAPARAALARFVLVLTSLLTLGLFSLSLPSIYAWLASDVYHLKPEVAQAARWPLLIMVLWPALIAWRRFHQGHLILQGRGGKVGRASLFRVGGFALALALGSRLGYPGAHLGAAALMLGLFLEAGTVVWWARQQGVPEREPSVPLPQTAWEVAPYYAPLALTMLLTWGGRAALVAIIARSVDAHIALAAWAAGWGFVILVANLTRMVQQLVIKYARQVPLGRLLGLGFWSGSLGSLALVGLGHSALGEQLLQILMGHHQELHQAAQAVVAWSLPLPLLVALQNVLQGYCIVVNRNLWVNLAGLLGLVLSLSLAHWSVSNGHPGAVSGAWALNAGLLMEVLLLGLLRPWRFLQAASRV